MESKEKELEKVSSEIENAKTILKKKEKSIVQQKLINNLLSIYQHKLLYYSSFTSKNKSELKKTPLVNLPKIKTLKSTKIKTLSSSHSAVNLVSRKDRRMNQYERIQKKKKELEEERREKAKNIRDKMKVMNDNLKLYRDSIVYENANKRRIINVQREIEKKSIENYRSNKKQLIDSLNESDFEKFSRENRRKINELTFLKRVVEEKKKKKSLSTTKPQTQEPSKVEDFQNLDNLFITRKNSSSRLKKALEDA